MEILDFGVALEQQSLIPVKSPLEQVLTLLFLVHLLFTSS